MNTVHDPNMTRISLVSSNKFKICLLKGEMVSTDSSSSITEDKQIVQLPVGGGVVNVYGKSGIGKTTYMSKKKKFVQFDHDILKTKERTRDFLDMMRHSMTSIVLDDYEVVENMPGVSELRALKNRFATLYIVSKEKLTSLPCITQWYEFPGVPVEDFAHSVGISVEDASRLLEKTRGNMTTVKLDLETTTTNNVRDEFMSSKEYVERLLVSDGATSKYVDHHLAEHGNIMGIFHENYPDLVAHLKPMENVSHSLSDADIIDAKIYSDVWWDLMPFFNVSACLIPSLYMSSSSSAALRPGSIWTKNSNMLMKMNRLKKLRMHRDYIQVWVEKFNAGEEPSGGGHTSYDLDSINQLSLTKIKPRVLNSLKKKCRKV